MRAKNKVGFPKCIFINILPFFVNASTFLDVFVLITEYPQYDLI